MEPLLINKNELLSGLNEAQKLAVENTDGAVMIIAGAGSGKTRVLTFRLAYILQQNKARPYQLLALTFTNKAAREMRSRIQNLIGSGARDIQMGTFHSVFSRILRLEATKIGFTSSFTVYDEDDSLGLIKNICKELNIDEKQLKAKTIKNQISGAKNKKILPAEYERMASDRFSEAIAPIYKIYQERLIKSNSMDFDDLLLNMIILFRKHPDIAQKYSDRFKYIMVDEYQDTNVVQEEITRILSNVHKNICVVGDDAQSIYSFRGATIDNILNFQKHYKDVKVFKLEQNYRSTSVIVNAANDVIRFNQNQLKKNVYTQNSDGELIKEVRSQNEYEEADKIADSLREQRAVYGYYNKDFAILYRTNAQSRSIEDSLRRIGIPYRIFGGLSFYKRKEIKDVVAYLRLIINPSDEQAIRRVINYPLRGIGETSVNKIFSIAIELNTSPWEVIKQADKLLTGKAAVSAHNFATLIQSFQQINEQNTAFEVVAHVAKFSGILPELHRENTTESLSRFENVQELINAASEFVLNDENEDKSLAAYLSEIALYTDADEKIEGDDYVSLMTVHASKGLEFKSVIVTGLEEGLFPSKLSSNTPGEMEEERRLFYVAITRAEKNLTLTYAQSRSRYGMPEVSVRSRFIGEIDLKYFKPSAKHKAELDNLTKLKSKENIYGAKPLARISTSIQQSRGTTLQNNSQSNPFNEDKSLIPEDNMTENLSSTLKIGDQVYHAAFGNGEVLEFNGVGDDLRAKINFKLKGIKTLILKYAKLKIIS